MDVGRAGRLGPGRLGRPGCSTSGGLGPRRAGLPASRRWSPATCTGSATVGSRGGGPPGGAAAGYGLDAAFHRVFFFLPKPIRLLILKDLRTFRRDPAQWSQFLIFFGLLAFYFINIRRLSYDVQKPYWRNLISFLNLSVTALILSTFTSRFIFPLLSLEGRNFWVLGLLPLKRASILWGKFAFSRGSRWWRPRSW